MRVKVVGGGIAGLSSALFVSKATSKASRIVVYMKKNKSNNNNNNNNNNVDYSFTGLWTPALVCLETLGLLNPLLARGSKCVVKSGYMSKSGKWLATPNKGLYNVTRSDKSALSGSAPCPALLFVKTRDLVSVLLEAAQQDDKIVLLHDDEWSREIESSQHGECDLIIAADGMNSAVKRHFHPTEAASSHAVSYKHYDVYRGNVVHVVKDKDLLPDQTAFQTWGPGGKRFACVPTHEGYSWFAALCKKPASSSSPPPPGAFFSLSDLKREFAGYHAPIDSLLQSTHSESFSFTPAFASRASSYTPISTILPNSVQAVVYVGDAALCLDPILAQGAGCAIEDGRLLHDAIKNNAHQGNINDTSDKAGEVGISRDVLACFEKSRATRREKLLILSQLATSFGNISSPLLCSARNALFAITPSKVKGRAMDAAIAIGIESSVFEKE